MFDHCAFKGEEPKLSKDQETDTERQRDSSLGDRGGRNL